MNTENNRSVLLPEVLRRLENEEGLSIFDSGSAASSSIEFFSQWKCRLHFIDIYNNAMLSEQENLDYQELVGIFEELILVSDEVFDVCFLWDLPNYLDNQAIRAFADVLKRRLNRSTAIHAFSAFSHKQPFPKKQYSINGSNSIASRQIEHNIEPKFIKTYVTITKYLDFLGIEKSTLLTDGRLELYLKPLVIEKINDLQNKEM